MTRRRTVALVATAVVLAGLVAVVASCASEDAAHRMQRRLGLDDVSSKESIRAGLLARLPVGTPRTDVAAFLDGCGVGSDASERRWDERDGRGVGCRFDFKPGDWGIVKETYVLRFAFDDADALRDVDVDVQLTGP